MASDHVDSQCIARLAGLDAVGALVEESLDVGLNVLLHCRPDLAGEVTLRALPAGLPCYRVVARDHQLVHLQTQIQKISSSHTCLSSSMSIGV